MEQDFTTLVCLFHHQDVAQAALKDLANAGIPSSSISVLDSEGSRGEEFSGSSLELLGVPEVDQQHLLDGLRDGGVVVAVSAYDQQEGVVEGIFKSHSATKIDEAAVEDDLAEPNDIVLTGSGVPLPGTGEPLLDPDDASGDAVLGGMPTVRMYRTVVAVPVDVADVDGEGMPTTGVPVRREI